jgi:hypothetical protein
LNANSTVQCFTARLDPNFQLDSFTHGDSSTAQDFTVTATLFSAGPSANLLLEDTVVQLPAFIVHYPSITLSVLGTQSVADGSNILVGDTAIIQVTLDETPLTGLNYTLRLPGATLSGSTAADPSATVGQFLPAPTQGANLQQQVFTATFNRIFPVSTTDGGEATDSAQRSWSSTLVAYTSGADAARFKVNSVSVTVVPRQIGFYVAGGVQATSDATFSGDYTATGVLGVSAPAGAFTVLQPVLNGLTVTPVLLNSLQNSVQDTALPVTFQPANFTFQSGLDNSAEFSFTGNTLGSFEIGFLLSGPDQPFFTWASIAPKILFQVTTRPAPVLVASPGSVVYAGVLQGPLGVSFVGPNAIPPTSNETVVVSIQTGSDVTVSNSSLSFGAGSANALQQVFSVLWTPTPATVLEDTFYSGTGNDLGVRLPIWITVNGSDAYKYSPISPVTYLTGKLRSYTVVYSNPSPVVGVRYTGYVQLINPSLPTPAPLTIQLQAPSGVNFFAVGGASASNPFSVSFSTTDNTIKYFEYSVTANITTPSTYGSYGYAGYYYTTKSPIVPRSFLDLTTAGAVYYQGQNMPAATPLAPVWRQISFDGTNSAGQLLNNRFNPSNGALNGATVFQVNVASPVYTLVLSAPPSSASLQVTISHPALQVFPSTITFAPGQVSAQFYFVPIDLPATTSLIAQLNVAVTGAEAGLYDYSSLYQALKQVQIIPALAFTPFEAMYVDDVQENLAVWLAPVNGFPFQPQSSFVVTVQAAQVPQAVYFSPSTFTFTSQSLASNSLSQRFSISHVRPSLFGSLNHYDLTWSLRFEGSSTPIDITPFVPLDAQRIILKRYNIQPQFPFTLDFSWQSASFNITRGPLAALTFTPHQANEDGAGVLQYAGAKTAGGRLVFEPPVIAFLPGQSVTNFQVKAIAGVDQRLVYYRVQWLATGNADDIVSYLDLQPTYGVSDNNGQAQFATWHIAPASALTSSLLAVALLAIFALLM